MTGTTGTPITSIQQIRELAREVRAEVDAEAAAKEAATGGSRQVALDLLAEELGSREQALEALALNPGDHLQRLGPKIKERSEQLAKEAEEREARQQTEEYAASPEGRAEAALAAASKAEERKKLAAAARQLLVDEGIETAERAADIPDALAIQYAGIEPSAEIIARREEQRLLSDPAAMAEAMAEADRAAAKARLYGPEYHNNPSGRAIDAELAGVDLDELAQWHKDDLQRRGI